MKVKSDNKPEPTSDISTWRSPHLNLAAVIVFILALIVSVTIVWRSEQNRLLLERARVSDIAGDYAHTIQANIERTFSAAYALAAMVRQGKGSIPDFDAVAREMLPFYPGAASLQLAPDGIVRRIVPLAGNEGAIGHNLLKDPARTKEAFLARDTGKLTLAGPFPLVQGGVGAAGRLPVFLDNGNGKTVFWGFTIVLIRFPDVLDPALLSTLEKRGFWYELWRTHPDTGKRQVIAASSQDPLINPVERPLEVPNGTWTLSVAPVNGWGEPLGLALKAALGLLFSLLLFVLTHVLININIRAAEIAQNLTADLRASEEKYKTLIESANDAVFIHEIRDDGMPGPFLEVNELACRQLGYSREELSTLNPMELDDPRYRDRIEQAMKLLLKDGRAVFETAQIAKDGRSIPVEVSCRVVDIGGHRLLFSLVRDITERKRVEATLSERAVLAELSAEIGYSLTMQGDLQSILNKCTESMVRRLDAAFARIWIFNAAEKVLELRASAGMYTAIDGSFSRVPMGKFMIGLIAEERKPHVTDTVIGDPRVHDQEWARREGMVAFAGYPLTVEERLVGVMAMFFRNPPTDATIETLATVSHKIAIGIERKRTEEELRKLNEELEMRVKLRTAELEATNTELKHMNKLFVGRELRMTELKERIRALETALTGKEPLSP